GYIFAGFVTPEDVKGGPNLPDYGYSLQPGDLKYKDLNGDGKINTKDQKTIGYPRYPEYTFGVNMGVRYKNFDLTLNWAGVTHVSRELYLPPFRQPFGEKGS